MTMATATAARQRQRAAGQQAARRRQRATGSTTTAKLIAHAPRVSGSASIAMGGML
jgi:hypothetical protein